MPRLVDLTKKPYYLTEKQIDWVEKTLSAMTLEEKIGQLFFNLFFNEENQYNKTKIDNKQIIEKYHIGGARYQGGDSAQVQKLLNNLQKYSKIPLLIAANCDSGGNGACSDGTYIASGAASEAAGVPDVAYHAGYVSAKEAQALGINVNFDPCVDILFNWRNTIVNTRAYGDTADKVIKYTSAYIDGFEAASSGQMITCIKHFPGDGFEERDQHMVLGINDLSVEEWDASFGRVYKHHIDRGVPMMMAGHIAMPTYSKHLNPELDDEHILPATLSPELITGLLKEQLSFNGLLVTDASHMLGMTASMPRKDYVPLSIAAGCDMFLFFNELDEDFNYMLQGYKSGIITPERLDDAVRRILGLKAKLDLAGKGARGELQKSGEALEVIGCPEHQRYAREAADASICLLKDKLNVLPLNPDKHKRLLVNYVRNNMGDLANHTGPADCMKEELERRGFTVTMNYGESRVKGSVEEFKKKYDAVILIVDIFGYASQNNYRIDWPCAVSNAMPWYQYELPTVGISLNYTTHLHDLSMMRTFINAYSNTPTVIKALVSKLVGETNFKGKANDLVWCNQWENLHR